MFDWLLRFIKGMLIGSGAILPGVSGGALAAVFGFYERIIAFIANIRRNFKNNFLFLLPVLLGVLLGIFALSFPLEYFSDTAKTQLLWFFIGCIAGTIPSLYKEAGKKGRSPRHLVLAAVTAVLGFIGLWMANQYLNVSLPQNFGIWILAGVIFALGMIVPGLSPSNFLWYFQLYEPMAAGINKLDFGVIIPLVLGAAICVLLFAKLMKKILEKAYAGVFHFVLGIVVASTAVIVPTDYSKATPGVYIVSALLLLAGLALGLFMGWLEKKYKHEKAAE